MKGFNLKKIAPYAAVISVFIVLAYGFMPQLLKGKVVNQSDISSWEGMSREIVEYNQAHPDSRTLWTNSMFGGMPATTISVIYKGDFTQPVYDFLFTGERPASYLLISLIGGFLLFLAFGMNLWLAFLGAVAITFCSYNMQIIQVGHNTKMIAIAYMPWVLAAVVYAYRKSPLWGGLFFAFALSFQIKANHPQITYYLAIIILGYAIYRMAAAIKEKTFPRFIKTSLVLLAAGLLGIAANTNHLWPTYEYAQHTMRGGSELSGGKDGSKAEATRETPADNPAETAGRKTRKGLDLEYATAWSYGIKETPNLMIPDFNGGSSVGALDIDSQTYKTLRANNYAGAEQIIRQLPLYWGEQPFTAGPMYMGAISLFLFVLGFFVLKGGVKWWIAGVSLLALLLSWGYHLMFVSEFFFNWAPLYNKFRTVSMILVILQISIPVMAVLTVNELIYGTTDRKKARTGFIWALALTAGVSLLFVLIPSLAGDFTSPADNRLPQALRSALAADRISLLRHDAIRSFMYIIIAAGVLLMGYLRKLKPVQTILLLIFLVLADLWAVDKRYLNDSHFVTRREFKNAFALRPADQIILEDKSPDYRVLDLSVNTFNDAYVSYHHKTIGGYSPAKLQRYQDVIEHALLPEIQEISAEIGQARTLEQAQQALTYHPVLSMLNTKYIILNGNTAPLSNPYALGNAWFVEKIIPASGADQEIALLATTDPAKEAIVERSFLENSPVGKLYNETEKPATDRLRDSLAYIRLTSYAPNRLTYRYGSRIPQAALFSEIYYHPGWKAVLYPADRAENDSKEKGTPAEIFRADYILRGLALPAGEYEIEFTFDPESFSKGEICSRIASGLLIILLATGIVLTVLRRRKNS